MAQRKFVDLLFPTQQAAGFERGGVDAHRAAGALADRFDAPTIIGFTDALSFLDRMGGQLHIVTLREKVDPEGNPLDEKDPSGEWRTLGMRMVYETRDARIHRARDPEEVLGVEIRDFSEPAVAVQPAPAAVMPDEPGVFEKPDDPEEPGDPE
jgi:hypothetical protein